MDDLTIKKRLRCLLVSFAIFTFLPLKLYTQPLAIIETYEAGPEKTKKKVSGVKTNFSWTKPATCPCPRSENGPCVQTFLDKQIPQPRERYPSRIEDYYIQNNMGSEYQGAGAVPWGLDVSSVRIFNFPFCRQEKKSSKG